MLTENGFVLASQALQVWGGYGYIRGYGIEQCVRDARVPMKEVHDLFAGKGSEDAVMKAAEKGDAGSNDLRNQLCYAHLYLGLYHEALGHTDQAKAHLLKAAKDYAMDHYMGRTAQVHVKLRGWGE